MNPARGADVRRAGREQKNTTFRTTAARYASTAADVDGENALRSSQKVPKFFVSVSAKAR